MSLSSSFVKSTEEMENFDKETILQHAWAKGLLEKTQKATEKSVLTWCNIVLKIGTSEVNLNEYLSVFSDAIEGLYEDLILDINSIHQKVLEKIEESLEHLQQLCKELNLKMPDITEFTEVPLSELKDVVNAKVQNFEKQASGRRQEMLAINKKIDALEKVFGKQLEHLQQSPLPTAEQVIQFKDKIEELELEKMLREEKYLQLKDEIVQIMDELDKAPSLDFECDVLNLTESEVMITDDHMNQLESFHARVDRELKSVKVEISELRTKIYDIWEKLEVELLERDAFIQKHTGNSLKTLEALKAELRRCDELKQANIKIFIDKQRKELLKLWQNCHCTQETRDEFSFFYSDCHTEDLFDLHERELDKWKNFYEQNKEIFKNLLEHKKLWQQMLDLDSKSVDSNANRYKNRGGQLLVEEKLRRHLSRQIPKVEETLRSLSSNFYDRYGKHFVTFGLTIEEYLTNLHEDHNRDMKVKLSAKKQQRDQSVTTSFMKGSRVNLFGPSTSGVNPKVTPVATKRRFAASPSTEQSKKSKRVILQKKSLSCVIPKVNVSKSRRMSKIREERIKRLSSLSSTKSNNQGNKNDDTASTLYDEFEREVSTRDKLRSTGFVLKEKNTVKIEIQPPTPQKSQVFATPKGLLRVKQTPRRIRDKENMNK